MTALAPWPVRSFTALPMLSSSWAATSMKCSAPESSTTCFLVPASMPMTRRPMPRAAMLVATVPRPPPAPETTTHCPLLAPHFRSAAYVVTPAQSIGAATSPGREAGIGVT